MFSIDSYQPHPALESVIYLFLLLRISISLFSRINVLNYKNHGSHRAVLPTSSAQTAAARRRPPNIPRPDVGRFAPQ